MFKHIMLPTDGSELSNAAIQKGVEFARSIGASVTGLHVLVPSSAHTIQPGILTNTSEQYHPEARLEAENYLAVIERAAKEAGVAYDSEFVAAHHAYQAIIK